MYFASEPGVNIDHIDLTKKDCYVYWTIRPVYLKTFHFYQFGVQEGVRFKAIYLYTDSSTQLVGSTLFETGLLF